MLTYSMGNVLTGWRRSARRAMQGAFSNDQQVSADLCRGFGHLNPAGIEYK